MPYRDQCDEFQSRLDHHELPVEWRRLNMWGHSLRNPNHPGPHSAVSSLHAPRPPDAVIKSCDTFRHSSWRHTRSRVLTALQHSTFSGSRLRRFADCGSRAFVCLDTDQPDKFLLLGNYCKDRFCTPCANARSKYVARTLFEHFSGQRLRFVTLTLKTGDEPLWFHLRRLYASFRRLRQHTLWRTRVAGGVAFLEIKFQEHTQRWHPHLHILCHGKYLPKEALRSAWHKVTGDSYIIDVRLVDDARKAAYYVTKYATKALHSSFTNRPKRLEEALIALHHRRTLIPFGDWRNISLRPKCPQRSLRVIESLDVLLQAARDGNMAANVILNAILRGNREGCHPVLPDAIHDPRPPPKLTKLRQSSLAHRTPPLFEHYPYA